MRSANISGKSLETAQSMLDALRSPESFSLYVRHDYNVIVARKEAYDAAILSAQAEARIAAYEDAANVTCFRCRSGMARRPSKYTPTWVVHVKGDKREVECHASLIHAKLAALRAQSAEESKRAE